MNSQANKAENSIQEPFLANLSALLDNVRNKDLYTCDSLLFLSKNIKDIFDSIDNGTNKIAGILINIFNDIASMYDCSITDGIFYAHSYLNRSRVPIYFGQHYANEEVRKREEIANSRLWDRELETPHGAKRAVKYYHLLNVLVSEFKRNRYLLINFDQNLKIDLDQTNVDPNLPIIEVLQLTPVTSFTDDFISIFQRFDSQDQWDKLCQNFFNYYNQHEQEGFLPEINGIINEWQSDLKKEFKEPSKMFTNIYRYAIQLNQDSSGNSKATWRTVLYVPGVVHYKYRPGLVCNLLPRNSSNNSIQNIKKVVQSLSLVLFTLSNVIHGAEISLYERKGFLPRDTKGKPYGEHWLTIRPTDKESGKWSKRLWNEIFKEVLTIDSNINGIKAVYDHVLDTLSELTQPDQLVYSSYDAIVRMIMDCVEKIWEKLRSAECPGIICPAIELLQRLIQSENDLRFVSAYREHFIHSFHVFVMGLIFLRERVIQTETVIGPSGEISVGSLELLRMWFFASMYHDIAYAVEKMESLAEDYYHRVLLGATGQKGDIKPFYLDKGRLLADDGLHNYLLYCFAEKELEGLGHPLSRALAEKADHGVLSSYVLYNMAGQILKQGNEVTCKNCMTSFWQNGVDRLPEVCQVIALHHAYDKHWIFFSEPRKPGCGDRLPEVLKDQGKIRNALLMLLVLCDTLAQAGRTFEPFKSEGFTEQGEDRPELRLGNIHIGNPGEDEVDYIVDLVYSPSSVDADALEKLKKYLDEKLKVNNNFEGGWYEKPQQMIQKWMEGTSNYRKIKVRLFTAEGKSEDKTFVNLQLFEDSSTNSVYIFPIPV